MRRNILTGSRRHTIRIKNTRIGSIIDFVALRYVEYHAEVRCKFLETNLKIRIPLER